MRVTLPSGTPAELALPPGSRPPALGLVVHPDIGGLRPLYDEMCARLAAEQGWAVCAVEPFPGRESMTLEERMEAAPGLVDEEHVGDLLAAADLLAAEHPAPTVAVMGFCMGGMYAMKAAGTGRFDKAVAFYGMIRVPEAWRGSGQGEPLQALLQPGACPVLAVIGSKDVWTPPEDVESLRAIPTVTVAEYPEAEHGFVHDPSRPAHRPDDAADAWRQALAFLTP
ncbi:MAG TPA: dienelactone hydrolase family protein [Acidimicrobiales bacterium]|jgi:carboxymethylenebutenolidase|nr:dienelactone hydrolase family protein [Acidimicrobiales bacterium]